MATFRELVDDVIQWCNLSEADRTRVERYVNEAAWWVGGEALLKTTTSTQTLTAGQGDYSLRTDFLLTDIVALREVVYTVAGQDDDYPLERVDPSRILDLRRATPDGVVQAYALAGGDLLRLYPTPATADSLNLVYSARGDEMTAADDTPEGIPVEHHDAVRIKACSMAARRDDAQTAQLFRAELADAMRSVYAWRRRLQGAQPARMRVPDGRRLRIRQDEYWPGDRY